jgi:SAM-dependent methyltransferase
MTHEATTSTSQDDAWPADGLEVVEGCPACGAREREELYAGLSDRLFGAPGRWSMWSCTGCGSGYLDPRPTPDTVGLAYASYFWHQPPRDLEDAPVGAAARARRAVRNDLLNRRLGYDLPAPRLPVGAPLGVTSFAPGLDRWARHLRRPPGEARLLDVGCANGEFLLQMKALGWTVTGIDIDDASLEQARACGLEVVQGTLTDPGALGERRFDAITLNHVIEHLPDPGAALRAARDLLAPGGVLWIATPNIRSLAHRRFGRDWLSLDPPRHLVVFSPDALRTLVRDAGFRDVRSPRPTRNAASIFAASAALQRGERPDETSGLPSALRVPARVAELRWARRPDEAEELIVIAS